MYPVPFNKIPDFGKLYLDYLSEDEEAYQKAKALYNAGFRENEDFFKIIESKFQNYNSNRYFDKHSLTEIIKQQNVSFGGNEATAANIELLDKENTFAVVTGQQLGLFTGNLYTIYKTITAIKLAKDLSIRFPNYNFVPVFWLESEDHDFEEANHVNVINKHNELVKAGYKMPVTAEEEEEFRKDTRPVGRRKLEEEIENIKALLKESLIHTDFTEKIFEYITNIYTPSNDFKHSFAQMMNRIFIGNGVIFLDPDDREIKKLLTPIFEKELNTSPRLCESIINVSAEIEMSYDLQVKPKVINLYFIHNGNRYLLEPREEKRFALRNSKRRFEQEELLNILFENPEYFSPNVVLRPICQDYLLPTIAYIGGPSEISYFSQLKPAYKHYDLIMPVIFPRASVSVVEGKIKKFFTGFNVDFDDIFHHKRLMNKVIHKLSEVKVDEEFSKIEDELTRIYYDLKQITGKIDKTLNNTVEGLKDKAVSSLQIFKDKLLNAQSVKNEITTAQIDKVLNNLYPNNTLQERFINILYFLNKYDESFINRLINEIDIHCYNHQVIEL
jgi:bacillithiol biosynthesis cysteine-adding enzyme BshC